MKLKGYHLLQERPRGSELGIIYVLGKVMGEFPEESEDLLWALGGVSGPYLLSQRHFCKVNAP